MAAHHCPNCRAFSWHGPGSAHWALRCPYCGTVAAQVPHEEDLPPRPLPGSPLVTEPDLADLLDEVATVDEVGADEALDPAGEVVPVDGEDVDES